jgi:Rieske Fe-S protein
MERREFLKKGCIFCIGGTLLIPLIESCTNIPVYKTTAKDNILQIPIEQFLTTNYIIVRPTNVDYNIAIIKESNVEYKSFVMICTHADNMLRFTGKEFSCSLHGSIFDINGRVKRGPAEKSLIALNTIMESNALRVKLK